MFSKATKGEGPQDGSPPQAARKATVASLIADGVTIQGDLATSSDLHLDGAVEGDISAGRLTIGESGVVTGSVRADSVEIRGRVKGTIAARQVRLLATARVDGDISHAELSIEAGAHFVGRSLEFEPATAALEAPSSLSVAAE